MEPPQDRPRRLPKADAQGSAAQSASPPSWGRGRDGGRAAGADRVSLSADARSTRSQVSESTCACTRIHTHKRTHTHTHTACSGGRPCPECRWEQPPGASVPPTAGRSGPSLPLPLCGLRGPRALADPPQERVPCQPPARPRRPRRAPAGTASRPPPPSGPRALGWPSGHVAVSHLGGPRALPPFLRLHPDGRAVGSSPASRPWAPVLGAWAPLPRSLHRQTLPGMAGSSTGQHVGGCRAVAQEGMTRTSGRGGCPRPWLWQQFRRC